ncbi:LacI family DNA-binding transcriptional regulator [Flavobacterium johnsoniae]|uniref:Sugar binding protein/LacI transcriptional regulator n=1 Tax=Flavobacterium johnsoniae (strain ATCC 17061 / DSM 2064 / JCM 8514 / BCRC 14874 / CCUG 350202 / NBRC 14942 / NCIMB 11054 / UW101) TaxID=376686 RepID=A5FCM3_FLAJ1|nr:LacI family DNA-binding transcriptional regulator [Flavobacterium johnsoniae]ABQ07050.1 sugar binding protein/LacI transcriptional regulator [Flavobacterium johnsoniae UW101]OXE98770.1 LacI family transcriptional regulator [Flavobacterium johnsoniae UW101]WQG81113.1 LacI family DNA-binding transcriptional regulator [Flavobacterium johnsoniae UW101]SHL32056.1 transcriptional regulator, LacI family [Flavobacterium johnsoniae]
MKRISIKDVALKAGVSIASVSYVLNNKIDSRIPQETIDKVKHAAEELNYRPNNIAKSLKTQRTHIIGLVVADIANPYFSQLARIIEDEANKLGYTLLIGSSDENAEKFEALINMFADRQADGLIIAPVENSEKCLLKLQKQKIPFVLIDRYLSGVEADSIQINNYDISQKVTEHLINGGYKNTLLVAYKTQLQHLLQRTQAFLNTLEKHQIQNSQVLLADKDYIDRDINTGLENMLQNAVKPDAIFFTSNKLAVSGLKKLTQLGINIPQDIAVAAFDETEAYELFPVPLTYVKQPLSAIGTTAVKMLNEKINIKNLPLQNVTLHAELHIGQSTKSKHI